MPSPEIQRIALLVALGVVAYLLVLAWNEDYGRKPAEAPEAHTPAVADSTGETPVGISADVPGDVEAPPPIEAETGEDVSDLPDADLIAPTASPREAESVVPMQARTQDRLVEVDTPTLKVWIDRKGGDIVGVQLPRYPQSLERPDVPFLLLDSGRGRTYVAQSGLVGADGPDAKGRPLYESAQASYEIQSMPQEVVLTLEDGDVVVEKRFRFDPEDYYVEVEHVVKNAGAAPFEASLFAQLKRDGLAPPGQEGGGGFNLGPRPYVGAALTTDESRYEKLEFDDIDELMPSGYRTEVQGGWMALLQHYFLSAWVAAPEQRHTFYGRRHRDGTYLVGFAGPTFRVAPGETGRASVGFYAGPKDQKRLEAIAPNLNLTVDYGFLWWLAVPLFYLLDWLHAFVANWGLAIILLTLVVKLVLYPLSAASYRSMANMRRVSPALKRVQERYADDRQKLSQEMMNLYRKEKINPLGGCLPILIQMPVFISLYWVLYESVELRQAPFVFWIQDLAAMDPYFVLPILMGGSMFAQQLLNPPMPDPVQARIMKMMPIMFTVLFLFFPSGLVLYWLVNNLLSMAQQWFITHQIESAGR